MPCVIVAVSGNNTTFAMINCTTAGSPSIAYAAPGLSSRGWRVAFVGSMLAGQVWLVDISNPAVPLRRGMISTVLAGIGAIAVRGTRVAVGERHNTLQSRIRHIDFSSPISPSILATAPTPLPAIGSLLLGITAWSHQARVTCKSCRSIFLIPPALQCRPLSLLSPSQTHGGPNDF